MAGLRRRTLVVLLAALGVLVLGAAALVEVRRVGSVAPTTHTRHGIAFLYMDDTVIEGETLWLIRARWLPFTRLRVVKVLNDLAACHALAGGMVWTDDTAWRIRLRW